ncbi:hypothetical protein NLJ89_g10219 [Agrocybe chaxingu]|uniref:Uncharacterized protein n=1 Tax=Agrocybe chaxingu TaxID=84603 RepID=A0A9W8JP96_9AGAR|nr:hypothetical protein NLJ89_g10219 [Agrocybe chaxingu]
MPTPSSTPPTVAPSNSASQVCRAPAQADLPIDVEEQLRWAINSELNPVETLAALRIAQTTIIQLRLEGRNKDLRIAELELAQNPARKSGDENAARTQMRHLAYTFSFLFTPFIEKADFPSSPHDRPSFAHDHPSRYDEHVSDEAGLAAELFFWYPRELWNQLCGGDLFGSLLHKDAGSFRSTMVLHLHTVCTQLFDGLVEPSYFTTKKEDADTDADATTPTDTTCPPVRQLLALDEDEARQRYPPILFKNANAEAPEGLFMNDVLILIARIVIYGPKGAFNCTASIQSNSAFAMKGKSFQPTPGMIAWCAIMARFLLSGDAEFTSLGVGSTSSFNYLEDFVDYKHMTITGSVNRKPWHRALFNTWMTRVFPTKKAAVTTTKQGHSAANTAAEKGRRWTNVEDLFGQMNLDDTFAPSENQRTAVMPTPTAADNQPRAHLALSLALALFLALALSLALIRNLAPLLTSKRARSTQLTAFRRCHHLSLRWRF